jgi:hypothetical protein
MKLFIKTVIIFCIPVIILIGVYLWSDPFKIIHNYDIYLSDYIMLSRGYVSTKVFLKNNKDYHYNSFIFGSSRSTAFTCKEWQKYLSADCSAFSYGAWNESIEGIVRKIQFINSKGNKIKNVIIIIDTDMTFKRNDNSLDNDHYLISGKSFSQFHLKHFSEFLSNFWLMRASVDYKLFKTRRSYMKDFIGMNIGDLDPINNDWLPNSEDEILKDSAAYYSGSITKFYERPKTEIESGVQINSNDSLILQKINLIFKKQKTQFLFIIGPLYDQVKFNKRDLQTLHSVFGEENIFDFSGINNITDNMNSYSNDAIHYRKRTGNRILETIYKLPQSTIK